MKKLGNINLYQQTVLLKIIYDFRIEISFMQKYKFLISKKLHSNMYFQLHLVSKGWLQSEITVRHYNGKNKQGERDGGGLRIWHFQG